MEYMKRNYMKPGRNDHALSTKCICYRPYSNIICNSCGFWTKGRVGYSCPQHPKIVFLHDYTRCPRCKSYDFMLTEI